MSINLSKSLYIRRLQCPKSLWLKKYKKEFLALPDKSSEATFETGNQVGALACQLFPNGIKIDFDFNNYDKMLKTTKKLIKEGQKNIYEASFDFDNIFVAVDILHVDTNGNLEIYEVKSSTSIKDVYLHDISMQYYVLKGLGYTVSKVSIIHINSDYIRDEELDINGLLTIADITDKVKQLQDSIPDHLELFRGFLGNKNYEPQVDIGKHCTKPYECDAMQYCWKHIPEYSIFNISGLRAKKKFKMYNKGIINFSDIQDISSFSTAQKIQIQAELTQQEVINRDGIRNFLSGLTYPIYHLDFETFQQAIPEWKGIRPFMQIPFQYSIHLEHENGDLEHREFLAEIGGDPRYFLTKRLVEDIPKDVTVLAYNMGFEKSILRNLAKQYTEFSSHLMQIHDNIQDLMIPFKNKDIYYPDMKGSYSIKYVLPALVPEMKTAYKKLDLIHNGGEAMQAYANLSNIEDMHEKQRFRQSLLEYCELDTYAMAKILEKMKKLIG